MIFRLTFCALLVAAGASAEPSAALDLPATLIFDKGPNEYDGEVLEITRGRGTNIGWYVEAEREQEVRVFVEYACAVPLNQAYQLSFDGKNRFWEVEPTSEGEWGRAELGSFEIRAGLPVLVMLVPPSGTKYPHPVRFRKLILKSETPANLSLAGISPPPPTPGSAPGFGRKLDGLHPALESHDLRDESLTLRISGMALRGPNELLFTTWDGDLFSFDPTQSQPRFRRIARGLSEPMGLAVAEGRIFVTEKNQATELIDEDGDGAFETYRCVSQDWPGTMDYHEYLFGAVIRDGYLYFCSSVGMARRGKDNYQAPLRGSVVKVHLETGETEFIAGGLRTPDGIGAGPDGALLVTDNQGEWLPANKLIAVEKNAFYGFRSIPPWHPLDKGKETPPAVWLPQGEIAMSPTQPIVLPPKWQPYAGHVIFGDASYGGLQRAFLEEVEGVTQGAVFRFSQGFQHRLHRFALTPGGELYAGGIARGSDEDFIHSVSGLTRIRYTGSNVFEPLTARIRTDGLEIEFAEPLAENAGWNPAGWHVTQWGYQATQNYGGRKVRFRPAEVRSATVSLDRRKVFLELPGMIEGEVLHVRLPESLPAESGRSLWSGDLWYTVNRIPGNRPGAIREAPPGAIEPTMTFFDFREDDVGETVYATFCAACHSIDGSPRVGPTFQGLAESIRAVRPPGGETRKVEATRDYLRQSILEPNGFLADGYAENLMPPLGDLLTQKQIDAVVDFILKESHQK